jgi:NAD-reducing hydrogenase small subunit
MSFLDQDERLIELSKLVALVHSPLADIKDFPENVDITLVEGAIANEDQLALLKQVRERTKILVSFGDCAVTGNVTALRNSWQHSDQAVLERAYKDPADLNAVVPTAVPKLLIKAHPLHEAVQVDYFIDGCPPSADLIHYFLVELLSGRQPIMEGKSKYG